MAWAGAASSASRSARARQATTTVMRFKCVPPKVSLAAGRVRADLPGERFEHGRGDVSELEADPVGPGMSVARRAAGGHAGVDLLRLPAHGEMERVHGIHGQRYGQLEPHAGGADV